MKLTKIIAAISFILLIFAFSGCSSNDTTVNDTDSAVVPSDNSQKTTTDTDINDEIVEGQVDSSDDVDLGDII